MKRVWLVNINKNCKGQAGPSSRSRPPGNGDGFWSSLSFKGCGFLSSQLPVLDPRVFEQTENSYAQMWLWWALLVGTPGGHSWWALLAANQTRARKHLFPSVTRHRPSF